jgi:hypothetical protein
MGMFRRIGIIFAVLTLAASARADEQSAPKMPAPERAVSMPAYADADPKCLEWTNACSVCARNEARAPQCSTPGPACLPKAIVCTRR